MPIYEYKCAECEARVERMQKLSDEPLTVCEVCGGNLEKQWSLSGFQFKGAGWYVTDYAGKGKETAAEKSNKEEKSEKTEKSDKTDKTEKTEKTSSESTAATESASNKSNDTVAASSKKDTVTKKD